jgi:hypothetical protein
MHLEEYVSETTTVLTDGIWRVEIIYNSICNEANIVFGTLYNFKNNFTSSDCPLTSDEFAELLPLLNEANRIITKKLFDHENLQQEDFQADAA